jgi:hypothetical protein
MKLGLISQCAAGNERANPRVRRAPARMNVRGGAPARAESASVHAAASAPLSDQLLGS